MPISARNVSLAGVVEEACRTESNIFGYGIWTHHILSVVEYGKQLADLMHADAEIVEIAALLHDYPASKIRQCIKTIISTGHARPSCFCRRGAIHQQLSRL